MRKKKQVAEFRYYKMPENCALFALLGEKWRQKYERDIDYLHLHNYLEIGYCYEGDGRMILGEEEIQYQAGDFTVIPSNFLHTTNSAQGRLSSWEYLFVDVEKLIRKATAGVPGRMEKLMRRINSRATLVSSDKYPYLGEQIRTIMNIMRGGEAFCQEEAEALMTALLMEVARRNGDGTSGYVENTGGG